MNGVNSGKLVTWGASTLKLTIQIVRRPDDLHTIQVLPRRWVVERTFSSKRTSSVYPIAVPRSIL